MTKYYVAYLDVLGSKNNIENENFEDYIEGLLNFQNELIKIASRELVDKGRIHFFSDCAFIESSDLRAIVKALRKLRADLFNCNLFIRGALINGKLGAVSENDTEESIRDYYKDDAISKKAHKILKVANNNLGKAIKGTLFLSKDVGKAVYYESILKGSAFYVENNLIRESRYIMKNLVVNSGYISNIRENKYISFYDLKIEPQKITEKYIEKVFKFFTLSNMSDISYGRYYLTILITCVNSCSYNKIKYENNEFKNSPPVFTKILGLRDTNFYLYNSFKGLEFLYFALINKFYNDIGTNDEKTKAFCKKITSRNKYLEKYKNCLSSLPKDLISIQSRNLFIKDVLSNTKDSL